MKIKLNGLRRDMGSKVIIPELMGWSAGAGHFTVGPRVTKDGKGGIVLEMPTTTFSANGDYWITIGIPQYLLEEMNREASKDE
ncbi:hypothetical protein [Microvirga ossetica]|uniref:hypothetical protein n=1 Tax=Microvirga ossetica TaxID=1882682 RepID=UPI0012FFDE8C|nr:hypothetical protein [Microvirga ossetica]